MSEGVSCADRRQTETGIHICLLFIFGKSVLK